jgi:glyoxylase-like metal-dependent hydrolase (beta-lactamase superfamily II)
MDPRCWVIDPGQQPGRVLEYLRVHKLTPDAILLTHAHVDHIAGLEETRRAYPDARVCAHQSERHFYSDPQFNLSIFMGMPISTREPTHYLQHGQQLTLNDTAWRVLHTPGHSPGGITFVCDAAKIAIVGDTLFAGSIGRVDFPTSDPALMHRSLHDVLMALPDTMVVHPGHGGATTIGRERTTNPFLRDNAWAAMA